MPKCDCGAFAAHVHVVVERDGVKIDSITTCPECRPKDFPTDQPWNPVDRVVTGPEAYPHLYKLGVDGIYRPTDELQQDTEDQITRGSDAQQAIERKRATRRTTPMSEVEIKEAEQLWRQRLQNSIP